MKDKKYQNHQGADPRLEWPTMKYRFWPSTPAEWRAVRKARETGDKYVIIDGVTYSVADIPLAEPEPELIPPRPKEWRTYKGEAIPWNRPAWATERTIEHLTQLTGVPPGSASKAAFDAARDVLVWSIGREDTLADERHAERLAKGVQAHLRPFVRTTHYRSLRDWPPDNWTVSHGLEQGWPPFEDTRPDTLMLRGSFVAGTPDEWEELTRAREAGDETAFYTMPHYRNLEPDELARLDELAMVDTAHGRVPWLSVQLAKYLRETFGDVGDKLAETWLTQEAEREGKRAAQVEAPGVPSFALPGWSDQWNTYNTPPALAALALAAWRAELRPELERVAAGRERAERWHAPALPLTIARPVLTQGRRVDVDELGSVGLALAPTADVDLLRAVLGALHTLAGHRLLRWLPSVAWRTAVEGGGFHDGPVLATMNHAGGVAITVQGGIQGLATVTGSTSEKDRSAVRDALNALVNIGPAEWATEVEQGRVSGLVSSLQVRRGGPGRPGEVVITLPPLWTPGAIQRVPRGSPSRVLAPVLSVPGLPRGLERLAPALAALDSEAVIFLATNAAELASEGGVRIPWGRLARELRVNDAALRTALDWWTDEEPRWARAGERWTLADRPELAGARALLAESGDIRLRAKANGQLRAKAKREGSVKRRK